MMKGDTVSRRIGTGKEQDFAYSPPAQTYYVSWVPPESKLSTVFLALDEKRMRRRDSFSHMEQEIDKLYQVRMFLNERV